MKRLGHCLMFKDGKVSPIFIEQKRSRGELKIETSIPDLYEEEISIWTAMSPLLQGLSDESIPNAVVPLLGSTERDAPLQRYVPAASTDRLARPPGIICMYPDDRDSRGRRCGRRAATVRPGARRPGCYKAGRWVDMKKTL